ncbi:MAG: CDP-diacylglycerol--glycerol-3-phosphate 3-phosphatidyltransferase [Oscillospiraceae bacterium]|jgi:CDP-diacylglycerol--glycerol-3-phosphate 3-phosphatidyltransferase|nr:CDP-diacylglycerol--glycerol-3-phosphate 3-phosphatidyltransferase [Oscillospiraceae bacterium]
MTTANKITLFRVVLVPLFMAALLIEYPGSDYVGLGIFILAGITDHIDGYVARKYNQITTFGKFIDPLADKLLVTAALLILVERGRMPSWCAMIIIAREFAVSGLRLIAAAKGVVIAAGASGKVKTVVSIVAVCFMLTAHVHDFQLIPGVLSVDTLAIALIVSTTLWSGIEYFVRNHSLLEFQARSDDTD